MNLISVFLSLWHLLKKAEKTTGYSLRSSILAGFIEFNLVDFHS